MGEFKIDTAKDGDVFICRTKGYLDDVSGKKLKELCEGLIATGTNLFIFNLQETPVINSTGLSMLLDLVVNIIDYNDGKVAVVGLTNLTKNALRMTGVLTLCQDFSTEAEALTALKG